jgi:DNA-binding SARP family transcriptional activator/tetratricopeptide (TPR) repeat protein
MLRQRQIKLMNSSILLKLSAAPRAAVQPQDDEISLALRDAQLLAWLALEGPTLRVRLAALLWPESDADDARNSLRQRLFKLHKQIGAELVVGSGTLSLADGVEHDLTDSDAVLGDTTADNTEFGAWLAQQRERRTGRMRQSLVELSDRAEEARDYADALSHAGELLALEPLSEAAHRRVIRFHYLGGDRAAALMAFDRCEQMLKNEIGTTPSAETLALLQTVEAANAAGSAVTVATALPASVLRPPRLVGRNVELGAALRAWHDGRVFCLEGEAGMGKSRLLQEIAQRRLDAVSVQARPGDAVVPYATLTRLLRALLSRTPEVPSAAVQRLLAPVLPELAGPNGLMADAKFGQRLALGQAVAGTAKAASAAGVGAVIVDDLHFADDASLEMLLELSRGASGLALQWGFARRPAEGSPVLAQLTDALFEEERLDPVPLVPLSPEQLSELVGSLGLPSAQVAKLGFALHQHTGGNPMFALETLRQAWVETGLAGGSLPRPVSVTRLIEQRVMRLSPAAIRLARCASVAGVDFSIELAAVVLAVPVIDLADAWSELELAHVFTDGVFAHDLIYEAVRAGLPRQIARHLHGEVASHLEQSTAAPASIATHWMAAGQPQRSLPFLHRAGELAAKQRRFGEATTAYEQEARLRLEHGDSAGAFVAALRMRLAAFELDLGSRTDAALELLELAATTPLQQATAFAERAIVCMHRGTVEAAELAVTAGLAALGSLAEPGLRALLRQHLAGVRIWQQRPEEAYDLMRSIERDVEATGDAERRIEFAQAFAVVLDHLNRPSESAVWHRLAADTALAAGELPRAAQTLLNLALGLRDSGHLDRALATLEEARALLASLPEGVVPYSSLDLNFGIVLRDLGRYGEALDWFDLAIERGRAHVPGWVSLFLSHRAQVWLAIGQMARAQQDLDAAAAVKGAPPLAQARRELTHAQLLRMLGQDSAPALERAASHVGQRGRPLSHCRLLLLRCTVLDPADALAAAGEVLDAAMASQRLGVMVAARTRLCQASLALGHVAEATRHARQLASLAQSDGSDDLYRAEVWLTAYRALIQSDPQRAEIVLRTALKWLRETARNHVPELFRDSFLHRNPVNRDLLALASKLSC